MSPGWEQPPSHPPSSLSFSLPHGSEIIHPPTDRCCVGGRCQGARSVWCKRVCVPALCLHVSICAHERLSVHLRACTCRSRVSRAASFRLDADMSVWLFDEFTCICPPANIFPLPSLQGNNTVILSDWPRDYHLLFSSAPLFLPLSFIPLFHLPRAASVRRTSTDGAWEKAGSEAHSLASLPLPPPLLPSPLQRALLSLPSSFLPLPSTLLSPCPPRLSLATFPSLPRCSPYPLYFHPSAPPSSHSPPLFFFWFIICNMILPSPVHAA